MRIPTRGKKKYDIIIDTVVRMKQTIDVPIDLNTLHVAKI